MPTQYRSHHSSQLLSNTCVTAWFLTLFNVFSVTDVTSPRAATAGAAEYFPSNGRRTISNGDG